MLRDTSFVLAAGVAGKVIGFLLCLVLVRRMSAESFGVFTLGSNVAALALVLSSLGLPRILVRDMTANPGAVRGLLKTSTRIRFATSALAVVATVLYGLWAEWPAAKLAATAIFAASALPLSVDIQSALDATRRFPLEALLRLVRSLTFAVPLVVISCFHERLDVTTVAIAFMVAAIAYVAGGLVALPSAPSIEEVPAGAMLRQARAVMWAAVMMQALDSAGLLLLERISGDHEVGLFGVAQRFQVVALLVPIAAGRVLYPALCRAFHAGKGEAVVEDQIRVMTFLVVPPCLLGILLSRTALSLFPPTFAASETSLWILLFAAMTAGPCSVLATSLIAAARNRAFAVAVTAGTATSLAGGWMLIPAHGASGAAFAVLAAECVTGAAALLMHRTQRVEITLVSLLLPVACMGSGAAVLLGISGPVAAIAPLTLWAIGSLRALRLVGAFTPPREAI